MTAQDASMEQLESRLTAFTPLEAVYRDYYLAHHALLPMPQFLRLVDELNQQGHLLFGHKLSSIVNAGGDLQVTEVLFRDNEDVSIDKHPRYNPEFIHHHQFFEITYILSGRCKHTVYSAGGPEQLHCTAGDVLILSPGILHSILVDDDESIVLDILVRRSSFDRAFLHNIPDTTVLAEFFASILYSPNHANYILFQTGSDRLIRKLVFDIYREYLERQLYSPILMNLLLAQLLMQTLRGYGGSVAFSRDYPRDVDYIPMIMQYMENNYASISVQDIADQFSFSLSHLGRLYKSYTNSTLSKSLRTVRMKKAADFLLGGNKSVEEIAQMVGYRDTTNFIRRFKQYYGQTPKQYRLNAQTT